MGSGGFEGEHYKKYFLNGFKEVRESVVLLPGLGATDPENRSDADEHRDDLKDAYDIQVRTLVHDSISVFRSSVIRPDATR